MTPREWDATTYDRVSGPQAEWAARVLDRLPLEGDETVLDAGCGSGRVTRMLLERLPRGRVIAVDSSEAMVEHAREALDERATVFRSDLVELELDREVDAVFSNAVFHWIPDHQRLFERMYAVLRPSGVLIAQCGGEGNTARLHEAWSAVGAREPYAPYLTDWKRPWNFASAEETADRLRRAGFEEVDTWLEPYPVTPEEPSAYLRTVCLGPHLELMPEDLHASFVEAVREQGGDEIDYVRLNIAARRPTL
jgi:trans-aconitate 2-methyltransferase